MRIETGVTPHWLALSLLTDQFWSQLKSDLLLPLPPLTAS